MNQWRFAYTTVLMPASRARGRNSPSTSRFLRFAHRVVKYIPSSSSPAPMFDMQWKWMTSADMRRHAATTCSMGKVSIWAL